MQMFEVESEDDQRGMYHEHWFAKNHLDAAQRAFAHAGECVGIASILKTLRVSSMRPPAEVTRTGGLCYVSADTRVYVRAHGRTVKGPSGKLRRLL